MSHLRFDDETDRIAKYRLKATGGYLQTYAGQYRYPIDYASEPDRNYRDERSERKEAAIQLKRSYPKNYQQYRLLRSRLPREPRERPAVRSSVRESRNGLAARELASSSSSKDSKLLNNRRSYKALINGEQAAKEIAPLGRGSRTGGDRILSSILSSKIVSLKDNEQITASKTTTGQRINFRSELLPNLVYNNLIRRAGALEAARKPETRPETRSEASSEASSATGSENVPANGDASREPAGNEQSINQLYIQRYSNQTVKNGNSTDLKRHLNDAVLLTNVKRDELANATVSSNELPSILQSTLLSGDASSIQETLLPSINTSTILNLIKNLTNGSFDRTATDAEATAAGPVRLAPVEHAKSNAGDEAPSADQNDVRSPPSDSTQANRERSADSQQSADNSANDSQPARAISSGLRMAKSAALYNPLELQLIKLTPAMSFNRI